MRTQHNAWPWARFERIFYQEVARPSMPKKTMKSVFQFGAEFTTENTEATEPERG
jgi:hypothetical protein